MTVKEVILVGLFKFRRQISLSEVDGKLLHIGRIRRNKNGRYLAELSSALRERDLVCFWVVTLKQNQYNKKRYSTHMVDVCFMDNYLPSFSLSGLHARL